MSEFETVIDGEFTMNFDWQLEGSAGDDELILYVNDQVAAQTTPGGGTTSVSISRDGLEDSYKIRFVLKKGESSTSEKTSASIQSMDLTES